MIRSKSAAVPSKPGAKTMRMHAMGMRSCRRMFEARMPIVTAKSRCEEMTNIALKHFDAADANQRHD